MSGALYDRWMADALSLSKGQPIERATAMPFRTAVMLEIAAGIQTQRRPSSTRHGSSPGRAVLTTF
jgi:hypothetical protein